MTPTLDGRQDVCLARAHLFCCSRGKENYNFYLVSLVPIEHVSQQTCDVVQLMWTKDDDKWNKKANTDYRNIHKQQDR